MLNLFNPMQSAATSMLAHGCNLALSSNPIVPILGAVDNAVTLVAYNVFRNSALNNPILKVITAQVITVSLLSTPVPFSLTCALYATAKIVQSCFNFGRCGKTMLDHIGNVSIVAMTGIAATGALFALSHGMGYPITFATSALAVGSVSYLLASSGLFQESRMIGIVVT